MLMLEFHDHAKASSKQDDTAAGRRISAAGRKISEKIGDMPMILQKIRKTWKSKKSLQEDSEPPQEFWW